MSALWFAWLPIGFRASPLAIRNVDSDIIHILKALRLPDFPDKPNAHAQRRHLLTYSWKTVSNNFSGS